MKIVKLIAILLICIPQISLASNKHWQSAPKSQAQADAVATNEGSQSSSEVNVDASTMEAEDITIRGLAPLGLVPHNNTSNCIKVWGFATGNKDVQGILGYPQRDKECDLQRAAEDAFSQGQIGLGWHFKCNMRSIKKLYKHLPKARRYQGCMADIHKMLITIPMQKNKENKYLKGIVQDMKDKEIQRLRKEVDELEQMIK